MDVSLKPPEPQEGPELLPEEREILSVGLFVDVLKYEFKRSKGYSTAEWQVLFKFWYKSLTMRKEWTAGQQKRVVNYSEALKGGLMSLNTQSRLYGDKPWYPDMSTDEREQMHI